MAILEEEVWVTVVGGNYRYFEDKGYQLPKHKNKLNKEKISYGEKILVKIEDLSLSSHVSVTKICDLCDRKVPNQLYSNINKQRKKNGIDVCQNCSNSQKWEIRYDNIPYEKTLEGYAKRTKKEYLLKEYSNKNTMKSNQISYGSNKECFWNCPKCKNEYDMVLSERSIANHNCPYCSGQRVLKGFNDIHTTHPEISRFLTDQSIGHMISAGCNQKVSFTCVDCGHETVKTVGNVTFKGGYVCPRCSDGISYPEKFMMNVLDQLNIMYETQKTFIWSQKRKYDFYIPSFNCIIETHGQQHYRDAFHYFDGGATLEETQLNDLLKENLAKNNGIDKYIVIDCSESEINHIKQGILNSQMVDFLNLGNIDWLKSHEFSLKTMVKTSCDIWNSSSDISTLEIAKILKINRGTIIRYLKQGQKLGWCNYDPRESMSRSGKINSQNNNRCVIQLSLNGKFIKEWSSIGEAQTTLGINNVSAACRGVRKKAGGFKWAYKEEYLNDFQDSN